MVMPGKLLAGGTCQTCMMREGSSKGSGRRMTALTTEKIAVLAPMPRARTTMAAAENAGLRRRVRKEKRKSDNRFLIMLPDETTIKVTLFFGVSAWHSPRGEWRQDWSWHWTHRTDPRVPRGTRRRPEHGVPWTSWRSLDRHWCSLYDPKHLSRG